MGRWCITFSCLWPQLYPYTAYYRQELFDHLLIFFFPWLRGPRDRGSCGAEIFLLKPVVMVPSSIPSFTVSPAAASQDILLFCVHWNKLLYHLKMVMSKLLQRQSSLKHNSLSLFHSASFSTANPGQSKEREDLPATLQGSRLGQESLPPSVHGSKTGNLRSLWHSRDREWAWQKELPRQRRRGLRNSKMPWKQGKPGDTTAEGGWVSKQTPRSNKEQGENKCLFSPCLLFNESRQASVWGLLAFLADLQLVHFSPTSVRIYLSLVLNADQTLPLALLRLGIAYTANTLC